MTIEMAFDNHLQVYKYQYGQIRKVGTLYKCW